MILPKLWVAAIPWIWDKRIPNDNSVDTSGLSIYFDNKDIAAAVKIMENSLRTDDPIIKYTDDLKLGQSLLSYLGCYNVKIKDDNHYVLLYPRRVSTPVILAYRYDEETLQWIRIEDASVIDGYVYGTLKKTSAVAIFAIRRSCFYTTIDDVPVFVANGIPITISTNDEDKIIVTDKYNSEFEIDSNTFVIGGSIDGYDVCSTDVYADSVTLAGIAGGSYCSDHEVKVNNAKVRIVDCEISSSVCMSLYGCSIDKAKLQMTNTKANIIGAADNYNNTDNDRLSNDSCSCGCNSADDVIEELDDDDSICVVNYFTAEINNCEAAIIYNGSYNGISSVYQGSVSIDNGKYIRIVNSCSSGEMVNAEISIKNAKITSFQNIEDGITKSATFEITDSFIRKMYLCAPNHKCNSGSLEELSGKLKQSTKIASLSVGYNNGEPVSQEVANDMVSSLFIDIPCDIRFTKDGSKRNNKQHCINY